MKIRFGLYLDSQRGWHPKNRLGELTVGPMGLLDVLETQLGLIRQCASPSERIVQYRDCLKRCDSPERFYHRTFNADELGTAAMLLAWRDLWHLHGWDGRLEAPRSKRLQDIGAVEKLASGTLAPSVGERLARILDTLDRRRPAINEIVLVDPLEALLNRWQAVLARLPVRPGMPDANGTAKGFLGKLQTALWNVQVGKKVGKLHWEGDGSVTVVQAETLCLAGRWLAAQTAKQFDGGSIIVAPAEGQALDSLMAAADRPLQGFGEPSVFRPTLQVLPMAMEILWEPLNFYGLLQLLTHPVCPVPGFARNKLAEKLAEKPGIGGASWVKAIDAIDAHYAKTGPERAMEVREAISLWVEHPRFDPKIGAPLATVIERANRVMDFFRVRLADDDRASRLAYTAGYSQSEACVEALEALSRQGEDTIRPRQLQQILSQATSRGSENPLLAAEVGCSMAVTDPAAVIDPFDRVVWWQLGNPTLPTDYPWSATEIEDLADAGVHLPTMEEVLDRTARNWLRPILAAKKELILVLPPKDQESHPVWLMIQALVDKLPVKPLETLLTEPEEWTSPILHKPLPTRRRWWQLPAGAKVVHKGRDSFSSLELFLFNPYHWLLKYPARLVPSKILSVSSDFFLYGNLAHELVDRLYHRPDALGMDGAKFKAWYAENFDRLIGEEGAILLMPGRRADLENLRIKLERAMQELHWQLVKADVKAVKPELELTGHYRGGEILGYADLVITNTMDQRAVVDMKWSGSKKYPEKLKQNLHLQLAIYAQLLQQQGGSWPAVAYYILDRARLFARDNAFFPDATTVTGNDEETIAELWQRFLATWKWRKQQVEEGRYEVAVEGIAETEDSEPPESGMAMETLSPDYNNYLYLAGWEE